MYNYVLAAIDLTEGHEVVAAKAAVFAKTFGARFSMVHVVKHSFRSVAWAPSGTIGGFGMPGANTEDEIKQKVDDARDTLHQLAETNGQPDAKCHVWVATSIKSAVGEVLQSNDIDLMVVGSHQRGALDRMLVNSNGYQLLRNATCDTLVVDI